jgi:hypothetical protein
VTHPFHPLHGSEWELVDYRHTWGEDRVYFHDADGVVRCLPAAWTSVRDVDLTIVVGRGRAAFRVADLLELVALIRKVRR